MRTEIITSKNPENIYPTQDPLQSTYPQPNDLVVQSILLEESYSTIGVPAVIELSDYGVAQVGYHPDITFTDEVTTHILMNELLTPKLLKQLGWSAESDSQAKPLLASVPRYLSKGFSNLGLIKPLDYYELKINKYSKITLSYDYFDLGKIFQVTEVSSNMFNPVFYYLKLAPYYEEVDVDPTPTNDSNLTHLIKEGDSLKHITLPGKRCPKGVPVDY